MKYLLVALWVIVMTTLMPVTSQAGWLIYHKPEYKGRVVDAESNEPIEGAVVVVSYGKVTMGLGAGSNSSIINVRETKTDKEGKFVIPSYTTLIQPFSWEWSAMFTIYRPGYANADDMDLEDAFSAGAPKAYEVPWINNFVYRTNFKFIVSQGVVALPKLRTKKERLIAFPSIPADMPGRKLKLLIQMINDESHALGLSGDTQIP